MEPVALRISLRHTSKKQLVSNWNEGDELNIQRKLTGFYQVIRTEAENKKQDILLEIKTTISTSTANAVQNMLRDVSERLLHEENHLTQLKNKRIVQTITESRRKLINMRNDLRSKLIESVNEKLSTFVQTQEYMDFLCKGIQNDFAMYDNGAFEISQSDANLLERLCLNSKANIKLSDDNFIGGYKIILPKAIVDRTFKTKLEALSFNQFELPRL